MLAAQGAAELFHQVAYLVGDGDHGGHALGVFQTDQGTDVQATHAGMAVVGGLSAVAAHDLIEPTHEGPQFLRVNRRVFNKWKGFGVAVDAHEQPQSTLSEVPNPVLARLVQHVDAGVGQALALDVVFQGAGFRD